MEDVVQVHIDSRDRSTGQNAENFHVNLSPSLRNIKGFSVYQYEIPFSYYTIRTGVNDSIDFDEGGAELNATLSAGSYSASQLATELKTQLDATGALTYTITYSTTTLKYSISATGGFSLRVTTGTNASTTAYTALGYTANQTYTATALVSDQVANLTDDQSFYITSNALNINTENASYYQLGNNSGVIQKVQVSGNPGDTLFYQNENTSLIYKTTARYVDSIDLRLHFYDGEILNLNGQEWNITLLFYI